MIIHKSHHNWRSKHAAALWIIKSLNDLSNVRDREKTSRRERKMLTKALLKHFTSSQTNREKSTARRLLHKELPSTFSFSSSLVALRWSERSTQQLQVELEEIFFFVFHWSCYINFFNKISVCVESKKNRRDKFT